MSLTPKVLMPLQAAEWIVEPNGSGGVQYRRTATGQVFTTNQRKSGDLPFGATHSMRSVLADCITKARGTNLSGSPQRIHIDPAVKAMGRLELVLQGDSRRQWVAFWQDEDDCNKTTGWHGIRDIIITSDPNDPAIIQNPAEDSEYKSKGGVFIDASQDSSGRPSCDDITYRDLKFYRSGGTRYVYENKLTGPPKIYGLLTLANVDFDGDNWAAGANGGPYKCKSNMRLAYRPFQLWNCGFTDAEEHCIYTDAHQGDSEVWGCFQKPGTKTGRTFMQQVQRAIVDGLFLGGPPANGRLLIYGNLIARNCFNEGSGALTLWGNQHASGYWILNNDIVEQYRSCITITVDMNKGIHFTTGHTLLGPPFYCSGTAFVTSYAVIRGNTFSHNVNPGDKQAPVRLAGCEHVEIGVNDFSAIFGVPNVVMWDYDGNKVPSDPLQGVFDSLAITFGDDVPRPIASNPEFAPGKLRWGDPDEPQQTGLGGGLLTAAQINSLPDKPWPHTQPTGDPPSYPNLGQCLMGPGPAYYGQTGGDPLEAESAGCGFTGDSEAAFVLAPEAAATGSAGQDAPFSLPLEPSLAACGVIGISSEEVLRIAAQSVAMGASGHDPNAASLLLPSQAAVGGSGGSNVPAQIQSSRAAAGAFGRSGLGDIITPNAPGSGFAGHSPGLPLVHSVASAGCGAASRLAGHPSPIATALIAAGLAARIPHTTGAIPASSASVGLTCHSVGLAQIIEARRPHLGLAAKALVPSVIEPERPGTGLSALEVVFGSALEPVAAAFGLATQAPALPLLIEPLPCALGIAHHQLGLVELLTPSISHLGVSVLTDELLFAKAQPIVLRMRMTVEIYYPRDSMFPPDAKLNTIPLLRIQPVHAAGPDTGKPIKVGADDTAKMHLQKPGGTLLEIPAAIALPPDGTTEIVGNTLLDTPGTWKIQGFIIRPDQSMLATETWAFEVTHNLA